MQLDPKILRNFVRSCPATHRALSGRRYLLPQKHQTVYANQDAGIQRRALTLLGSLLAPEDSFARRSELLNLLVALATICRRCSSTLISEKRCCARICRQILRLPMCEKDDLIRLDQKLSDDLYAASSQMIFIRRRSFDLPKKRKPPQPEAEL